MELNEFQQKFHVKTNFLEYGKICILLKNYLRFKEFPETKTPYSSNSYLSIVVHMDRKGVSKLYKTLLGRHFDIVEEACEKWNSKAQLSLTPMEIFKSFKRHSTLIDDSYAKYIQFRTLHQRFFTNDRLFKIGIKNTDLCSMCLIEPTAIHICYYIARKLKKSGPTLKMDQPSRC